jgi:AcrR family transcriptional regulator
MDPRAGKWIEAGLAEMARHGIDGVRVEVLAKNLGVTKGGFYRRFKDRAALLDRMLASGGAGRIAPERLRGLIRLYAERINAQAMAVELAVRQWARADAAAAAAVATVDAARLKNVAQLYRATGMTQDEADAQAFLFYCFIFGQSLLFLDRGPRRRSRLIAKAAEKLVG